MLHNPADFGTAEEAKAMLERAVAAVKEDKAKALDMFNKGEGGFKDRDLYVYCANASDGIFTAHPTLKGKQLLAQPMEATANASRCAHGQCPRPVETQHSKLAARRFGIHLGRGGKPLNFRPALFNQSGSGRLTLCVL
jgi:hypothetical protein